MRAPAVGALFGACVLGCHAGTVQHNVAPSSSGRGGECAVYSAVLSVVHPDSVVRRPVLVDSTYNRVYSRAFHAWTGMGAPKSGPGATIVGATIDSLLSVKPASVPLPACRQLSRIPRITWDTLDALFSGPSRGTAWDRYYVAHPSAAGFTTLSRIAFNSDSTVAIVYVGGYSHWLSGRGELLRLRLTNGKWIVEDRRVVWLS